MTLAPALVFPEEVEGYLPHAAGHMLFRLACAVPERGLIVELGSYKGRSTICLAQSGRKVWAVDHFKGEAFEEVNDKRNVKADHLSGTYSDAFLTNLQRFDYGNVRVLQQDTAAGPPEAVSVDLLFVDAAHDYPSVTADLAAWEPYMAPRGVIAFDDVNFPGVMHAVADAGQRGWRFLERAGTTIAVQRAG